MWTTRCGAAVPPAEFEACVLIWQCCTFKSTRRAASLARGHVRSFPRPIVRTRSRWPPMTVHDATCRPYWVDTHTQPPYSLRASPHCPPHCHRSPLWAPTVSPTARSHCGPHCHPHCNLGLRTRCALAWVSRNCSFRGSVSGPVSLSVSVACACARGEVPFPSEFAWPLEDPFRVLREVAVHECDARAFKFAAPVRGFLHAMQSSH